MAIDIEAPGAEEAALKAAIQALANEIVVVTLSANTTLDSTYYSKLTEVDTAGVAITFPAAPASQQTFDVINTSAGDITVNGLTVGAGKTVSYISINSVWTEVAPNVAGGGGYTDENARDAIGAALTAGKGIKKTINDAGDTITIDDTRTELYRSGRFYLPANYDDRLIGSGSAFPSTTTMFFAPILFRDGLTIDTIAASVNTLSAGGNFALYIYEADPTTLLPTGAPIFSSGNMSTSAVTTVSVTGLSIAVEAKWYWLGAQCDNTVAIFGVAGSSQQSNLCGQLVGTETAVLALGTSGNSRQLVKTGPVFGTPPTMTGDQTADGLSFSSVTLRIPAIAFKGV